MIRFSLAVVLAGSVCGSIVANEPVRPGNANGSAGGTTIRPVAPRLQPTQRLRVSTAENRTKVVTPSWGGSGPTPARRERDCRPHHHHHAGLGFRSHVFSGYPAFYGSLYGYDSSYGDSLRDENAWLYRELRTLHQQNEALQERLVKQGPEAKLEVPDGRRRAAAERAKQALLTGTRRFKAGDYRRAADRFADAIKAAPDDATPYFFRAFALFAAGQFPAAVDATKAGLKINADWPLADFDMKQLYGDPADLVPQLANLAAELKANPLDRDRLFLLGFVLFVTDDPGKAQPLLEQAARLEADDTHLKSFLDYYRRQAAPAPQAAQNDASPKPGQ